MTSPRYRHDPRQGFSWHNFKAYIRSPFFIIIVSGGGAYYLFHLERVPETGRWRFMDVSPTMEVEMGEQAFQETIGEFGRNVLPDHHPQARYVQGVVKRIIQANGLEGKAPSGWKTYVVKDDSTKKCVPLPAPFQSLSHICDFQGADMHRTQRLCASERHHLCLYRDSAGRCRCRRSCLRPRSWCAVVNDVDNLAVL